LELAFLASFNQALSSQEALSLGFQDNDFRFPGLSEVLPPPLFRIFAIGNLAAKRPVTPRLGRKSFLLKRIIDP
jgi:hypothetical protein